MVNRDSARPTSLPVTCDVPGVLLTLFAFFLPLSTSASTVLALLLALSVSIENKWKQALQETWSNPVGMAILAYVLLHVIGLLWTQDMAQGLLLVKKQWKLLLFPFFLIAVSSKGRQRAFSFFVAGVMCQVIFTTLIWLEAIHVPGLGPGQLTRGTFHVVYNPFLALAIYLLAHRLFLREDRESSIMRVFLLVLLVLSTWNMFVTIGRTGQVAFFVVTVLFFFQWLRRARLLSLAVSLVFLPVFFWSMYSTMPMFKNRLHQAINEASHFRTQTDTSVGMRVHFLLNTLAMIREHPFIGVGTGDFSAVYRIVNQKKSPEVRPTNNPHNQYLLSMVLFGIPGIVSLLAIFFLQLKTALSLKGSYAQIQTVFPVFFLTIMLGESYLLIHNTSFLFVLFSALLFRRQKTSEAVPIDGHQDQSAIKEKWLILAHCFNMDGRAASQTITDRIPFLLERGIQPVVVSAPTGEKDLRFPHIQALSPMPSGILFELRQIMKAGSPTKMALQVYKIVLTLLVAPFYLIEKILVPLDSQWSWFIPATMKGLLLTKKHRPKILYTCGGPPSAHLAGFFVHFLSGLPWMAELYDPLIYDNEPRQYRPYYQWKKLLEKLIFRHADGVIFFTETALERANQRHPNNKSKGLVIRPGAQPPFGNKTSLYQKNKKLRLCHFGSLAPKRNLCTILEAMNELATLHPDLAKHMELNIYGSEPDPISSECMKRIPLLSSMLRLHGRLERDQFGTSGREQILEAMAKADVLLLIHGTGIMCDEYVPSKTFEYLLAGRPILALSKPASELEAILIKNGHIVVKEEKEAIKAAIITLFNQWRHDTLPAAGSPSPFTVKTAVSRLVTIVEKITVKPSVFL